MRRRVGMGALVFLVLVVVVVLFVLGLLQRYLSSVTLQQETAFSGRRAYYLANAAINEAFLDFKQQCNTPGSDWFDAMRTPLTSGYSRVEQKTFTPVVTKTLYDESGIEIPEVTLSFWKQRSLCGLNFEKHGILTLTAKVSIPRRNAVISIPIRRSVQRSHEVKVVLAAPPHPFDRFTLFIIDWPYISELDGSYKSMQSEVTKSEKKIEDALDKDMEDMRDKAVQMCIDACKEGRKQIDEAWAKFERAAAKARRKYRYPPARGKCRKAIRKARAALEKRILEALAEAKLFTEARLDLIANSPNNAWMGAAGYSTNVNSVNWPPFRTDGFGLRNPAYAINPTVTSFDMVVNLPPFPETPSLSPRAGVKPVWQNWNWPSLPCISSSYKAWIGKYNAPLPSYASGVDKEWRRLEGIFKLVPDGTMSQFQKYLFRAGPFYWKAKAAYEFPDQAAFKKAVVKGDTAFLNGIYWVTGPCQLDFSKYRGNGVVVSSGNMDVGSPQPTDDAFTLTAVSRRTIYVNGSPKAALMAPNRSIVFNGSTVKGPVYEANHFGDDFTIKFDDRLVGQQRDGTHINERFTVTVSPYELANDVLRH